MGKQKKEKKARADAGDEAEEDVMLNTGMARRVSQGSVAGRAPKRLVEEHVKSLTQDHPDVVALFPKNYLQELSEKAPEHIQELHRDVLDWLDGCDVKQMEGSEIKTTRKEREPRLYLLGKEKKLNKSKCYRGKNFGFTTMNQSEKQQALERFCAEASEQGLDLLFDSNEKKMVGRVKKEQLELFLGGPGHNSAANPGNLPIIVHLYTFESKGHTSKYTREYKPMSASGDHEAVNSQLKEKGISSFIDGAKLSQEDISSRPTTLRIVGFDVATGLFEMELVRKVVLVVKDMPALGTIFRTAMGKGWHYWEVMTRGQLAGIKKEYDKDVGDETINPSRAGHVEVREWAAGVKCCHDECKTKFVNKKYDCKSRCYERADKLASCLEQLFKKLEWEDPMVREMYGGMSGSKVLDASGFNKFGELEPPLVVKVDDTAALMKEYHAHNTVLEKLPYLAKHAPKRLVLSKPFDEEKFKEREEKEKKEKEKEKKEGLGKKPKDGPKGPDNDPAAMSIELCGAANVMVRYASNYSCSTLRDLIINEVRSQLGLQTQASVGGMTGMSALVKVFHNVMKAVTLTSDLSVWEKTGDRKSLGSLLKDVTKAWDKYMGALQEDTTGGGKTVRMTGSKMIETLDQELDNWSKTMEGHMEAFEHIANSLNKEDDDVAPFEELEGIYSPVGIVHQDLNARNVMIDSANNLWIIDFPSVDAHSVLMDLCKMEQCIVFEYATDHGLEAVDYDGYRALIEDIYGPDLDPHTLLPAAFKNEAKWKDSGLAKVVLTYVQTLRGFCVRYLDRKIKNTRGWYPILFRAVMLRYLSKMIKFVEIRDNEHLMKTAATAVAAVASSFRHELETYSRSKTISREEKALTVAKLEGEDAVMRTLQRMNRDVRMLNEYFGDAVSGEKLSLLSDCLLLNIVPFTHGDSKPARKDKKTDERADIYNSILHSNTTQQLWLIGEAAAGKTTMVKQLLLASALHSFQDARKNGHAALSIHVPLDALVQVHVQRIMDIDLDVKENEDLGLDYWSVEEVSVSIGDMNGWDNEARALFQMVIRKDPDASKIRGILVFDGLDEVNEIHWVGLLTFINDIFKIMEGRCDGIIGTRPSNGFQRLQEEVAAIAENRAPNNKQLAGLTHLHQLPHFMPEPFNEEHMETLVCTRLRSQIKAAHFMEQLRVYPTAKEMAKSPLLLILIMHTYIGNKDTIPDNKVTLYTESMDAILTRLSAKGIGIQESLDETERREMIKVYLMMIAFDNQVIRNRREISAEMITPDKNRGLQYTVNDDVVSIMETITNPNGTEDHRLSVRGELFNNCVQSINDLIRQNQIPLIENGRNKLQFTHLSWQEFLASLVIKEELARTPKQRSYRSLQFKQLSFAGDVADFMASEVLHEFEKLETDTKLTPSSMSPGTLGGWFSNQVAKHLALANKLLGVVVSSRDVKMTDDGESQAESLAASNAITILSKAGIPLSGLDLHSVNISGASLRGAQLHRTNLRNAVLEDVDMTGCDLSFANLTGAYMGNVKLGMTRPEKELSSKIYLCCVPPATSQVAINGETISAALAVVGEVVLVNENEPIIHRRLPLKDKVTSLSFSVERSLLSVTVAVQSLGGGRAGSGLYVWDWKEDCVVRGLVGDDFMITSAALSPTGTEVLAACNDGQLRSWSVDAPEGLEGVAGEGQVGAAFSADGTLMAVGTSKGAQLLNLTQGKLTKGLALEAPTTSACWMLSFSRSGGLLAGVPCEGTKPSGGTYAPQPGPDSRVYIWETGPGATGKPMFEMEGCRAAFSPVLERVILICTETDASLHDLSAKIPLAPLYLPHDWYETSGETRFKSLKGGRRVTGAGFSPDGRACVNWDSSSSADGYPCGKESPRTGSTRTKADLLWTMPVLASRGEEGGVDNAADWVDSMCNRSKGVAPAVSGDLACAAVGTGDYVVEVWHRYIDAYPLASFRLDSTPLGLALSRNGDVLAITDADRQTKVYFLRSHKVLHPVSVAKDEKCIVRLSSDAKHFIISGRDRRVLVLDSSTLQVTHTIPSSTKPSAADINGANMVVGCDGGAVSFFTLNNEVRKYSNRVPDLKGFQYKEENEILAVAAGRDVSVWRVGTVPKMIASMNISAKCNYISITPEGVLVATDKDLHGIDLEAAMAGKDHAHMLLERDLNQNKIEDAWTQVIENVNHYVVVRCDGSMTVYPTSERHRTVTLTTMRGIPRGLCRGRWDGSQWWLTWGDDGVMRLFEENEEGSADLACVVPGPALAINKVEATPTSARVTTIDGAVYEWKLGAVARLFECIKDDEPKEKGAVKDKAPGVMKMPSPEEKYKADDNDESQQPGQSSTEDAGAKDAGAKESAKNKFGVGGFISAKLSVTMSEHVAAMSDDGEFALVSTGSGVGLFNIITRKSCMHVVVKAVSVALSPTARTFIVCRGGETPLFYQYKDGEGYVKDHSLDNEKHKNILGARYLNEHTVFFFQEASYWVVDLNNVTIRKAEIGLTSPEQIDGQVTGMCAYNQQKLHVTVSKLSGKFISASSTWTWPEGSKLEGDDGRISAIKLKKPLQQEIRGAREDMRVYLSAPDTFVVSKKQAVPKSQAEVGNRGHRGCVHAVLFESTKRVITSAEDALILFWDIATGDRSQMRAGHQKPTTGLWISMDEESDEQILLSCSEDKTIRQWSLDEEEDESVIRDGHKDEVNGVHVCNNGRHVLSCGDDGAIMTWDTVKGRLWGQTRVKGRVRLSTVDSEQCVMAALHDGKISVFQFGVQSARVEKSASSMMTTIRAIKISKPSDIVKPCLLLVVGEVKDVPSIQIWEVDLAGGQKERLSMKNNAPVASGVLAADMNEEGSKAAVGCKDRCIRVFDLPSLEVLAVLMEDTPIVGLRMDSTGTYVVSHGEHSVVLWNLSERRKGNRYLPRSRYLPLLSKRSDAVAQPYTTNAVGKSRHKQKMMSDKGSITAVSINRNAMRVNWSTDSGYIHSWEQGSSAVSASVKVSNASINNLDVSLDGRTIAFCAGSSVNICYTQAQGCASDSDKGVKNSDKRMRLVVAHRFLAGPSDLLSEGLKIGEVILQNPPSHTAVQFHQKIWDGKPFSGLYPGAMSQEVYDIFMQRGAVSQGPVKHDWWAWNAMVSGGIPTSHFANENEDFPQDSDGYHGEAEVSVSNRVWVVPFVVGIFVPFVWFMGTQYPLWMHKHRTARVMARTMGILAICQVLLLYVLVNPIVAVSLPLATVAIAALLPFLRDIFSPNSRWKKCVRERATVGVYKLPRLTPVPTTKKKEDNTKDARYITELTIVLSIHILGWCIPLLWFLCCHKKIRGSPYKKVRWIGTFSEVLCWIFIGICGDVFGIFWSCYISCCLRSCFSKYKMLGQSNDFWVLYSEFCLSIWLPLRGFHQGYVSLNGYGSRYRSHDLAAHMMMIALWLVNVLWVFAILAIWGVFAAPVAWIYLNIQPKLANGRCLCRCTLHQPWNHRSPQWVMILQLAIAASGIGFPGMWLLALVHRNQRWEDLGKAKMVYYINLVCGAVWLVLYAVAFFGAFIVVALVACWIVHRVLRMKRSKDPESNNKERAIATAAEYVRGAS